MRRIATSKQIAQIKAYQNAIRKLAKQVNRPYSMAISMAIFPFFVEFILLNEYSPFSADFYNSRYDSIYQDVNVGYGKIDKYLTHSYPVLEQTYNEFLKSIERFAKNPFNSQIIGKDLNPAQILAKLDSMEGSSIFFKAFEESSKEFKNALIYLHNLIAPYMKNTQYIFEEHSKGFSLTELFEMVDRNYKDHFQNFPKKIQSAHAAIAKLRTNYVVNRVAMYWEIVIPLVAQYYIVDPLLDRFFPYGILQPKPPVGDLHQLMEYHQAAELISKLDKFQKSLSKKARRNVLIARYSSLLILGLAIALYNSESILSSYLFILALTALATASQNLLKDCNDYVRATLFSRELNNLESLLKQAIGEFRYHLEICEGENIESSYFTLDFKSKKISSTTLSSRRLADLFKDCCVYHNIKLISKRGKTISIPAQSSLTAKKAKAINELFKNTVERSAAIKQLRDQVRDINLHEKFLIIPNYDNKHFPILTIEFRLPKDSPEAFLKSMKDLFVNHKWSQQNTGDEIVINITGWQPLDERQLKALKQIKVVDTSVPTEGFQESKDEASMRKPKRKSSETEQITEEIEQTTEETEQQVKQRAEGRSIRWQSGTYDSEADNNTVHPIPFGGIHSKQSYAKARFFVKNDLDYDQLPDQIREDIKKKVDALVENPHFARKKGEQGWKFWKSKEQDQGGRWFDTAVKGKILGEYGNVRVFAEAETSSSGETLFVVKGIDLKTHKV